MQQLAQKGYTREEIINILHMKHGNRTTKFKYNLLDSSDNLKFELNNVLDADISMKSLANIKRTGHFTLIENNNIDWLNDRIQPFIMFKGPRGWLEWSLGIFLLSSPRRREQNRKIIREIEAYDKLQILADDKIDSRYLILKNSKYIDEIKKILNGISIYKINIEYTDKVLATDREFEIGTSKLKIINELLKELNYNSLSVDEWGYFTSNRYVIPLNRAIEYSYKDDDLSIIYNGLEEELDLFSVPNKFIITCSNPEQLPLTSIYINDNENSITSTVNRKRIITDFKRVNNIADQESLNEYTRKVAYEASNVYGHLDFKTALMPMHSYLDCLNVAYSSMNINDKYIETAWSMKLKTGAKMKHTVRKVVQV